jgi:F0F1-type ATP synthase membrane subunit c/vacuolar-type H+-ATPase subunit K
MEVVSGQAEIRNAPRAVAGVAVAQAVRRRVRTGQGILQRQAARRRRMANVAMLASAIGILTLVAVFYLLLSN